MTEMEKLIGEIKESTSKQVSINKADEIRLMTTMLNDPEFSVGIYDKKLGYIGQKCPHDEAVSFVADVIQRSTGLDKSDSKHLADNLEFTKKDANFLLNNMRSFLSTYVNTGRKINLIQDEKTEANVFIRNIPASTKIIPDKDNSGNNKTIKTAPYIKLVSQSRCPKYNVDDK